MTYVSVGPLAPHESTAWPIPIPRPRDTPWPKPLVEAQPSADLDTTTPLTRRTARGPALAFALDSGLALALALAAALLHRLPLETAVTMATLWPLMLAAAGGYRRRALGESRARRVRAVAATGTRASVVALAASPWLTEADPVALVELVAAASLVSGVHHLVGARRHRPRLVLAGRPRDVREAMLELQAVDAHDIVAACLTRPAKVPLGDLPTYVGFGDSPDVAIRHRADALVVLPGARLAASEVRRLHWALAGVGTELCVGTGLLDVTPNRTRVFASGGLNLVHVAPASLRGPRRWVKEVLERAAAAAALTLLLPALLIVGMIVRLDTSGPALYQQARVGRDGRTFTMFKFRSMATSADVERSGLLGANEADGVLFKIQQDPRITPLGRRLRRWSIDEVPQLWNVVRGDMSLVGPRPALPEEVAKYDVDPTRRLVVKPGLTGLWQVSGRSDLTWAQSVRLDVTYVDNWSLRLDLAILLRTARAVLGHRGAY